MEKVKNKKMLHNTERWTRREERLRLVESFIRNSREVGIDIGCGAVKCNKRAIGFDKIESPATNAIGDACDLSRYDNEKFDFIVSIHCLEHLLDTKKVLKEWDRTLKKGGVMIIITPDEERKEHTILESGHKVAFRKNTMKKLLKDYLGYKVAECRNPNELKDNKNKGDILCVAFKRI